MRISTDRFILFLWIFLFFAGCSRKNIQITDEYIINGYWTNQANAIQVCKLKVKKDSILKPFSDLDPLELLDKLENDSSFLFVANVKYNGVEYSKRKVYFNKYNGFFWWSNQGNTQSQTIGKLQNNSWYKISHLITRPYFIYVYVDSSSYIRRFNIDLSNY